MGIRTGAVYVEADSEAPFVREADEAVRLPGGYLDGDSILKAAQATGADDATAAPPNAAKAGSLLVLETVRPRRVLQRAHNGSSALHRCRPP